MSSADIDKPNLAAAASHWERQQERIRKQLATPTPPVEQADQTITPTGTLSDVDPHIGVKVVGSAPIATPTVPRIPVEILFEPEPKVKFSVTVYAQSIEVNEDGVSMVINEDINVKPPTLKPLTITSEGKSYPVVYAGGSHTFQNIRIISFVRVQTDD